MISKDIIIIGAGLTGLTMAHHLNKLSADFCVLEKKDRHGGVIESVEENGFVYERGPNTGVLGTIEAVDLLDDLKDFCELEIPDEKAEKRYVLKDGKWQALPSGIMGGIKTNLFTTRDKFNLLLEPFRKRGNNPHETLAELVKRRMGQSFLDYAIDPFVIGVYSGDPAYLVPKYAFPKLYNLEQNYGSFIGGAVKKSFEKKDEKSKRVIKKIFSTKRGLSSLTNALYKSANPHNFVLNVSGIKVVTQGDKFSIQTKQNGETVEYLCNKLITTVGSFALKEMLPFIVDDDLAKIENLVHAKIVGASIGFNNWTGMPLDAFGGLIPHKEKRNVLGYMFMSSLFEKRAPKNGALLTCFSGGVRNPDLFNLADDEVKQIIGKETMDMFGLEEFKPDLFKIKRYMQAIPQYGADSKMRFATVEKLQNEFKGLYIAGNLKDGIGIADRIKQATNLVKQIV